jgi:hypothetical protein
MVCEGTCALGAVVVYCSFSNASVTTMLPLLPPNVNVGCWTRELRTAFQTSIPSNDEAKEIARTDTLAPPPARGKQISIHLP